MIAAKTIEADVVSANKQRQIDLLEAQLHEAEDIITDLRSEVTWVRDRLEKAKAFESQERNFVNIEEEEETVSVHQEVVVEILVPDQEDRSSLHDVEWENDEDLEKAKTSESQERSLVNIEEEMVSAQNVDPEVVLESVNPGEEDRSSLHDVECENFEKAKDSESQERNLVNIEEERVSAPKVVLESLKPDQEVADTCFSLKIHDVECENDEKHIDELRVVDTVMGNDVCESELDGDIRIKKLELSRNGCTQRIHALERLVLERKSSSSADEEEQEVTTEKDSGESLSSGKAGTLGNTRCLVLALRASSAEVVTLPSNVLGIKKASKRRRKRRFGKPKAKSVRSQSQLIKPCCQSQSNATCSKTSTSDGEDSTETHLSVESREVLVDVLVSCEGEEDSVVPSTKTASNLVNLHSDSKVTAVVSDQISESPPRANVNRFLKYTFQRKRKRGSANIHEDSNNLPRKHQENKAQDQTESTLK